MVLGSRPTAGHWWRQEGHPVLNARARTKVLSGAPSKPQGIGGNGGKIERSTEEMNKSIVWQNQKLTNYIWGCPSSVVSSIDIFQSSNSSICNSHLLEEKISSCRCRLFYRLQKSATENIMEKYTSYKMQGMISYFLRVDRCEFQIW